MTAPTQDALDGPPCVDAFACEGLAVARALAVDPACGLMEDEAARRRARVGDNTVPTEPPRSLVRSVVTELRETMILVLLAAAVLTAVTGDFTVCAVILRVIAVNTTVDVVQERRAVGAVRALTTLAAPTCTVVRAGVPRRTAAAELVPGDVLLVAEGDVVGADARVPECHELQVDEALLTGESAPSDRRAQPPCPRVRRSPNGSRCCTPGRWPCTARAAPWWWPPGRPRSSDASPGCCTSRRPCHAAAATPRRPGSTAVAAGDRLLHRRGRPGPTARQAVGADRGHQPGGWRTTDIVAAA
jgi:magnesium-transporting ATPase (P-type)